jgi:hypothetical protein
VAQRISFYLVQKLEGRKVVEVLPRPRQFEEARDYVRKASMLGQRYGITRCDLAVDLVGNSPVKKISFVMA